MTLEIPEQIRQDLHTYLEAAYPEEGVGLLLGMVDGDHRSVGRLLKLTNRREDEARHNRYLLSPQDYMHGEQEADRLGLDLLGIFHSHPDHPNRPSDFDRQWAMPWFIYLITSVQQGKAEESRAWTLSEDHAQFIEEKIIWR